MDLTDRSRAQRAAIIPTLLAFFTALAGLPGAPPAAHASPRQEHQGAAQAKGEALATFDVTGERFRVWVTNPKTVQQLIDLRAGRSAATIPNGRILRGPGAAAHNAPWHWHLDPQDVQMAEVTTEACDGRPSYVEGHLSEFVTRVKRYCPWSARLVGLRLLPQGQSVPAAPSRLQIVSVIKGTTSAQQTAVVLRWRDNARNETGFRIHGTFTRMYGGSDSHVVSVGANRMRARFTFVAGGINPVKRACFTVSAFNAWGQSPQSNTVCIRL